MKHLLFLALLLASLPFTGAAQAPTPADRVRVDFTVIAFNSITDTLWFRPSEREAPRQLNAQMVVRSPKVTYTGPSSLVLFGGDPTPVKDQLPPPAVGEIRFPPKISKALVILFQQSPGRVVAFVTDDDPVNFPHHTFKVLNLSPATVALKIGETEVNAPPSFTKVFPTGLTREQPTMKQNVLMALYANEKWQDCLKTEVTFRAGFRYLLLVNSASPSPSVPPTLRIIPEQLIAVQPAAKPGQTQPGQKPPPGKPVPNAR